MTSNQEISLNLKTLPLVSDGESANHIGPKNIYDPLHLTPETALSQWFSIDKRVAKKLAIEVYKILSFGLNSHTLRFRGTDGLEIFHPLIASLTKSEKDMVTTSISVVGVALFPNWRVRRIEGMILELLNGNGWNVRTVKISCTQDLSHLTLRWDVDLPEDSHPSNSSTMGEANIHHQGSREASEQGT
jgi:hypothetical protein